MTNYNNLMVGLSGLTNLFQNVAQLSIDRNNGVDPSTALQKASYNLSMGQYRIGYAYGMGKNGNLSGWTTNMVLPYNDAQSNAVATYSLALSNFNPWLFFNCGRFGGGYGCYGGYGGFGGYYC